MAKQITVNTNAGKKSFTIARSGLTEYRNSGGSVNRMDRQYLVSDSNRNVLALVHATVQKGKLTMFATEATGRGRKITGIGRKIGKSSDPQKMFARILHRVAKKA